MLFTRQNANQFPSELPTGGQDHGVKAGVNWVHHSRTYNHSFDFYCSILFPSTVHSGAGLYVAFFHDLEPEGDQSKSAVEHLCIQNVGLKGSCNY